MKPMPDIAGSGHPAAGGVTVTVGPGPYSEDLLTELTRRGLLHRVIRTWPEFRVERWDSDRGRFECQRSLPLHRHLVRAVWATWRRVPIVGRYQTPLTVLYGLVDRLAARQLAGTRLFLGWSQVALQSLRAAREGGAVAALEHPMLHVAAWQETMREEYARFAPDAGEFYSMFPASLVSRMLAEYQEADHIVVPSSTARASFLERGVPAERLVTVPFGVDAEYFAAVSRRQPHFRVGFVGRLELLKGPQYLLQAWNGLRLENATLSLVGPVLPEMKPQLALAAAKGSVELLGQLNRDGVRRFIGECDALVFPTICDAFGLVMLEGMARGIPVIATTRSGAPDVISDGVDGFVVPPRDARAIADRIDWLHSHRDDCSEMGRRARLKVESRFTLSHYGDGVEQAYRKMMLSAGDRPWPDTPAARRA